MPALLSKHRPEFVHHLELLVQQHCFFQQLLHTSKHGAVSSIWCNEVLKTIDRDDFVDTMKTLSDLLFQRVNRLKLSTETDVRDITNQLLSLTGRTPELALHLEDLKVKYNVILNFMLQRSMIDNEGVNQR